MILLRYLCRSYELIEAARPSLVIRISQVRAELRFNLLVPSQIFSGAYNLITDTLRWLFNRSTNLSSAYLKTASIPLNMAFSLPPCP